MKRSFLFLLLGILSLLLAALASAQRHSRDGRDPKPPYPVINTHVHIDPRSGRGPGAVSDMYGAVGSALEDMDRYNVRLAIIMSPPLPADRAGKWRIGEMLRAAKQHPGRFAVMGGGAILNPMIDGAPKSGPVSAELKRRFERAAEDLLKRGAVGFGEMAALHFSLHEHHPFEQTPPDHPLFLLLADIAARHDVPIDLHMEAVTAPMKTPRNISARSGSNPDTLAENITAFERLLAHNPKARIVWDHVGMDSTGRRSPALTRRLMERHPNLFVNLKLQPRVNGPYWVFRPGRGVNPAWREVIMAFPDRFMVATDGFYPPPGGEGPNPRPRTGLAVAILRRLPARIARMLAYENAEQVYKLKVVKREARLVERAAAPGRKFLSQEEIRKVLIGRTIRFRSPAGNRTLLIHFADGGAALVRLATDRERVFEKRWFFKGDVICRTIGKDDRKQCTKVRTAGKDALIFSNRRVHYRATLLEGKR